MDYLLYIDTSADAGTVAVSADDVIVSLKLSNQPRNHAAALNIMINEAIADAGISLAHLNAVVVCAGPGSYTGLRIGMATAKGLCYALDKPLLLDYRLTLMAFHAFSANPTYKQYISLLKAREKEYFISIYNGNFVCTFTPRHIYQSAIEEIAADLNDTCIISDCGEGFFPNVNDSNVLIENNVEIDMKSWAVYAFRKYKCNDIVNLSSAEPFYLKQVYTHK